MKRILMIVITLLFIVYCDDIYGYTEHTSEEAIDWVKSKVGTSIDYDNVYGAQCIDLILAYYNYLGVNTVRGNAINYTTNSLPSGWKRIENAQPKKGDILIYTNFPYGHVAIYESDYSSFHQNYNHNYVENITKKYNGFNIPYWGVIRPDFSDEKEDIVPLNLGDNFNAKIYSTSIGNLALTSTSNSSNSNVYLYNNQNNNVNQMWKFNRNNDGSYTIKNNNLKLCLSVSGSGNKNKDNVYLSNECDNDNSKWFIYDYDNSHRFVPKASLKDQKAMDIYGNIIKSGNNIQIYEEFVAHNETQMFTIDKIIEDITIENDNIELVVGESKKIEYSIIPNNLENKKIDFNIDNNDIISIDSTGIVTALNSGKATLTLKTNDGSNISKIINIVVKQKNKVFSDVDENSWYYESVEYVSKNKIIKGYSNGKFGPNDNLTRAMFVTILHRLENEEKVSGDIKFSDVVKNSWYSNSIRWAIKNKIIYGYNDGTFRPNNNITRQDFIVILFRYSNYKKISNSNLADITKYNDYNEIDKYASNSIKWAIGNNILYGSNGNIMPKKNITRAETAAIMHRYINKYNLLN